MRFTAFIPSNIDEGNSKFIKNEYLQSVLQGYKFTFMDHIYEKDKKYYKYNDSENKFDEVKFS